MGRRCAADHPKERGERPDRGIRRWSRGRPSPPPRPAAGAPPPRTGNSRGSPRGPGGRSSGAARSSGSCGPPPGFTRRANSVLPLGDPGLPLDEALTAVRAGTRPGGCPRTCRPPPGAEGTQELLCAELAARGWVREVTAELWIGSLAPVADREAAGGRAVPDGGRGMARPLPAQGPRRGRAEGARAAGPRCGSRRCRGRKGRGRPPSGGASWTGGGPGSRPSRSIQHSDGGASPRP